MTGSSLGVRLAADIGGTFTDVVLEHGSDLYTTKVLTTTAAPEQGVVSGAQLVLEQAGLSFDAVDVFLHGTTLATNAIIERRGAATALIATDGFRDVIEIADESRFDQYDVFIEKPDPIVPRARRFTVPERIDVTGAIRLALDEDAVREVAGQLKANAVEAVAICFLHSYVNPAHELRTRDILQSILPDVSITVSSEVCPEAREYERTSTAILNAYVQPRMAGYLGRLAAAFAEKGYENPIHLMTSGGSLTSLETAQKFPVRLVESGPAGGAILAAGIATERDESQILSFDMGGTTAKICLIENGEPLKARTFEVDRSARFMKGSGLPVRIPVIEMVEIGAGGGSIARIDELKRIQVGPESAGSSPGPACYDLGGTEPAVTDADLVLGKIDPVRFAGGKIPIYQDRAATVLSSEIGDKLGLDVEQAAYGVVEIVDENMANAARVHAVERGLAISQRTMIAFGGAAPLHACRIAEKLGIERVIVPAGAGVGSAIGFLHAPAAYEIIRSLYMRLDAFDVDGVNALLDDMSREARSLAEPAAGGRPLVQTRGAYMRYAGQGHEIFVTFPNGPIAETDVATIREAFETEYRKMFARHIPDAAIEVMNWSTIATTEPSHVGRVLPDSGDHGRGEAQAVGTRKVFDAQLGQTVDAQVIERAQMAAGQTINGPAVIVEDGTSTIVSSSFDAHVDRGDALVLVAKESAA
ncbi:MAG: hydantoinase/oxoprolinase family protein [Pseudomonadota bacterium]